MLTSPLELGHTQVDQWLNATDAGDYLAQLLTLEAAFTRRQMWRYARLNLIPSRRLGRRVWFSRNVLTEFAQYGLDPRQTRTGR